MTRIRLKNFLLFSFLTSLFAILLTPSLVMAISPKGQVVFSTSIPRFNQVGGDPATLSGSPPFIARAVFDSLVSLDRNQNFKPGLARSWEIGPDWKYIDFFLRDDVTFHNGDKFTAEDVKFSMETYMRKDLKFLHASHWSKNIYNLELLGPYRIRFHLRSPDPSLVISLWWGTGMMPKKYREKVGDEGFADKPVGTGPFKWMEYKQDVYWKAEAVKKHFRHTPQIKTFKMIYAPEASTRLAMLKAGEVDITDILGPNIVDIKADPNLHLILDKYVILVGLVFADLNNPKTPSPFHDIRIREAVSLAIDREGITKKILFGMAEPYGDVLSPITKGYDPSIKPDPYNPERAKKLLAEAGYPKGIETVFSVAAPDRYWAEAVAANLREVGIKTKLNIMEGGAWAGKFLGKNFAGLTPTALWYQATPSPWTDLHNFFLDYMPWTYNTTPEIQQALLDCGKALTDKEEVAAGRKASQFIRESHTKVILWANHLPYGLGPRIEDWEPELGAMPACAFETIRLKTQYQ